MHAHVNWLETIWILSFYWFDLLPFETYDEQKEENEWNKIVMGV